MFAVKVLHNFLDDRLDAGFYRPDFLRMDRTLKEYGAVKLGALVKSVACGPFGGNAIADDLYAPEGIAFIRPVNISSHVFDDSSLVRVPEKNLLANGLKVYQGTNLYFGRVGDPCVAVITGETSISPNIIIANTDDVIADAHFIYAFAASKYGINQLLRQLKTVAQPTTSTDTIRDLLVIKPAEGVQKYIGDKVRQAERMRSWAKAIDGQLAMLESKIPLQQPATHETKHSIAALNYLTDNRLDAKFYERRHLKLESQFNDQFRRLGAITTEFKYGASVTADYVERDGISFIRGNALSKNNINTGNIVFLNNRLMDDVSGSRVKTGEVLITRSGTVGVACDVFDEFNGSAFGSFIIKCQPDTDLVTPAYLAWYLNCWVGQQQFRRWENGAVQLNINIEELSSIMVWLAPIEIQNQIVELIVAKRESDRLSRNLTIAAKFLVEALIEGQLSEADLIAAEQALQAGNDQPDRHILNRLKTDGVDGQGQALFSDLDQLYGLLEQADHS